ncbi:MAG: class I mannose-6-phosphate isomerase, partial [Planctomycetales bacterium]|nr:class I mannose-6-phosphate isomerase [Planctomycetales bacterium]
MSLYPFHFVPTFREYIWGGRRLGSTLGKQIGAGSHYAESWEVVDHGNDESVVANGVCAGETLATIVRKYPAELFGKEHAQQKYERFPLLFKFLDAHHNLSVQVHPNDEQAATLDPPDLGKSEAWYVLDAKPNAKIYAGLKGGVQRLDLELACRNGTVEDVLHSFTPQIGDCVNIPAGTVHALGEGLLVAEIQQSSDTTYRLYDWNRLDSDGNPRALHVQQALDVTDFESGPVSPVTPRETDSPNRKNLVACDKFILDRIELSQSIGQTLTLGGDDRFHILAAINGNAVVT